MERRRSGRGMMILSQKQRAFARAMAEGKSKADAQVAAGYRPNRKNANLLLRHPGITAEIERVREVIERERYRLFSELAASRTSELRQRRL